MPQVSYQTTMNLNEDYEVIVFGGGPAGVTAATAAAREGAKTLLIEQSTSLGGMLTNGLVLALAPYSNGERIVYGGLAEKILNLNKQSLAHVRPEDTTWVPVDPEAVKRICDDLVTEAGADILFGTSLCGVVNKSSREVDYAIVSNKEGLCAYRAKIYIDATGDADLAAWAGAAFDKGDEAGDLQPASLCFVLANVDTYSYINGPRLHASNKDSVIFDIVKSGEFPLIPDTHLCNQLVAPGCVGFNAGHVWDVDTAKPKSVSDGLVKGRKMAAEFLKALKKHDPRSFANAALISTATMMGIRESRRVIGDYTLCVDDYANRQSFNDEIARACYYIDIHGKKNDDSAPKSAHFTGDLGRYKKGESYGIPYRTLTPRDLDNVLVAGKTISCDRIMQGSVRVMPSCMAIGEGAGIAAAMAVASQNTRLIDVEVLRKKILKHGGYIE